MSVEIEIVIQFLYQQDKRLKLSVVRARTGLGNDTTHKQLPLSSAHLLPKNAASQQQRDERSECFQGKRRSRIRQTLR